MDGFARVGLAVQGVRTIVGGLSSIVSTPLRLAASAEQVATSFEVMTGSVEKANKLITDFRQMGAATPFEFADLSGATSTLLSFGRSNQVVLQDLNMLSNIASGSKQKLESLSLVFGQIASSGRLTGGDLLQLINVGFNPLNVIAEKTGESMSELRDRMSKGKVGFDEVRDAFQTATSAGGQFYQMNEKQSRTLLGLYSTMQDGISAALLTIGNQIAESFDLKSAISTTTELVTTWTQQFMPTMKRAFEITSSVFNVFWQLKGMLKIIVPIIGGVVIAMGAVVAVQKSIIMAQKLVLALSGPKGWATLAAGLAIAGAATLALKSEMTNLSSEVTMAMTAADSASNSIKNIGHAASTASKQVKEMSEQQKLIESRKKNFQSFNEYRRGLVNDISIAAGTKTELDIKLGEFAGMGFDERELDRIREMTERLKELREENERMDDLKNTAQQIKESLLTPMQKYQQEVDKLRELLAEGLLTVDEYDRKLAMMKSEGEVSEPDSSPANRLFQVAEFGSQAARSAVISHRMNNSVNRDEKQIADNTKKTNEIMEGYVQDFQEFKRSFYGEPRTEVVI